MAQKTRFSIRIECINLALTLTCVVSFLIGAANLKFDDDPWGVDDVAFFVSLTSSAAMFFFGIPAVLYLLSKKQAGVITAFTLIVWLLVAALIGINILLSDS